LLGKVQGFDGHIASIGPDLDDSLRFGDEFLAELLGRIEELVVSTGMDVPLPEEEPPPAPRGEPIERLDLRAAGIATVLWANGFRPDYSWIEAPLFDERGWPVQQRGVSAVPGLYFVGVHWLHKRKSSLLFGVGEDAAHIAAHIAGGRSR
jgi:putative flavoprotein involved in K+ transport